MSNAINAVKDGLIKVADWIEDHPWMTLGLLVALTILVIVL